MAESRGGRGNAVLTGFRLHQPATQPSARGQIPHSFGQECPWSRYPGILWYSRMPRPPAGEPCTTGTQCQGYGQVPNCVGMSIASSSWQYALPWAVSEGAFRAGTFWSVQTTRRSLRILTGKAVYAPVACRNSPPTPPLESEASEVPPFHPHPRSVQSGEQQAVLSGTSWGVIGINNYKNIYIAKKLKGTINWFYFMECGQITVHIPSPRAQHCYMDWYYSKHLTLVTLNCPCM